MPASIGVGVIGANAHRGWARAAHIPAIKALPEFELRAISTRSRESAEESAGTFGVGLAFDNPHGLIARPEVELVVITVQVHRRQELASAAIAAGKMVLCEWPLGRNLQEAEQIADLARRRRVRTAIGLQGRFAPAAQLLRELVVDGYFGKVLGTSIVGSGVDKVWAGVLEPELESIADAESGNTLLAIPAGHALDMLCFALGEFESVSSTLIARRGEALRLRDNTIIPTSNPDQVAFSGSLTNGALASVYYHGGASKGPDFVWEIHGTEGMVIISAEHGYANIAELTIRGARGDDPLEVLSIPAKYRLAPLGVSGSAVNIASLYAQFARDLAEGTKLVPDFDAAMRHHGLIDAIERSNATGTRQNVNVASSDHTPVSPLAI